MAKKIMIDAGHGGANPGAVFQGRRESDDALRLALAVGKILQEHGYEVGYTRTGDITQSVGQKAALANESGADLFVSIHRNAAEYPGQYSGVQTLIYNDTGFKREMAEQINENLAALGFNNLGVEIRPNLVVLNSTRMPALLVEAGFIDSEKDNQILDTHFQEAARAIADGIMETLQDQPMRSSALEQEPPFREEELYRVQTGAFRERQNAENLLQLLEQDGFQGFIIFQDGLYKVQVGAFSRLSNAIAMEREVRSKGYNTYITT